MSDDTGDERADAAGALPPPTPPAPVPLPVLPAPVLPAPVPPTPVQADPVLPPPPAEGTQLDVPDQQWPADAVTSPYIGGSVPASGNYRVLTAVIVVFLLALLGGAIALIVYLAGHTTLSFPTPEPEPEPVVTVVDESQAPRDETSPEPLTGALCTDFCVELSELVAPEVSDGARSWTSAEGWSTIDTSPLQAEEAAAAEFASDAGELTLTVWRFADDEAAEAAQKALVESLGEPSDSGPAFQDGTGQQSTFDAASTIVWSKLGDGSQPWVMQVRGTGFDAVQQFYYALPL